MPISVTCPHCFADGKVPDTALGKKVRCASCRGSFSAPHITVEIASPLKELTPSPPATPAAPPEPLPAQQKPCPFCGEQVLATAKKCRHCLETIDVVLRAAEEARRAAERQARDPMVFMNAGGGSSSAAAASSSAAVPPPLRVPERVKTTLPVNWNFRGVCLLLGLVLGGVAVILLRYEQACPGSLLLLLALAACGAAASHLFHCSFCKNTQMVVCFTPSQKCTKCGLIHVFRWE